MTELTTEVANLVTATNLLHEEVVAQKARLTVAIDNAMNSGGSVLEPRVKANEDEIVAINTRAETLAANVTALDTRVTTLETAKDSSETRLASAETKITALENEPDVDLTPINSKITELEASVADLTTRLVKVESDIVSLIEADNATTLTLEALRIDVDALKVHHPA